MVCSAEGIPYPFALIWFCPLGADKQQTVRIVSLDHPSGLIRTGDRSKVVFEFISHTEFVKEGQLILLREAKTKVLGVVTKVL